MQRGDSILPPLLGRYPRRFSILFDLSSSFFLRCLIILLDRQERERERVGKINAYERRETRDSGENGVSKSIYMCIYVVRIYY